MFPALCWPTTLGKDQESAARGGRGNSESPAATAVEARGGGEQVVEQELGGNNLTSHGPHAAHRLSAGQPCCRASVHGAL